MSTIVHAVLLPMPVHRVHTVCGMWINPPPDEPHGPEHEILGVTGPDQRVTCDACRVLLSVEKDRPCDWGQLPTLQHLDVEDQGTTVQISWPVHIAQQFAGQFLAAMEEAKAQNFLSWRWSMDSISDERLAVIKQMNPETPWDGIELVTYVRRKSGLSPEDLAALRLEQLDAIAAAVGEGWVKSAGTLAEAVEMKTRALEARGHAVEALVAHVRGLLDEMPLGAGERLETLLEAIDG